MNEELGSEWRGDIENGILVLKRKLRDERKSAVGNSTFLELR
jgi:hypothetical protein